MNKDKLNQHYKLDLDSLFAGGRADTSTPPPTQRPLPQSVTDHPQASLSVSWPSGAMNSASTVVPRPSSPSKNVNRVSGTGTLPPPPIPPSRTSKPEQTQPTRESIKSTGASFDINQFFGDFLSTVSPATAKPQTPSPSASSSNLQSLPMPAGRAPSLPPPPPIPARPGSQSSSVKRTSIHIKRVSTPNSDLLDLGEGLSNVPEVICVDLRRAMCLLSIWTLDV